MIRRFIPWIPTVLITCLAMVTAYALHISSSDGAFLLWILVCLVMGIAAGALRFDLEQWLK